VLQYRVIPLVPQAGRLLLTVTEEGPEPPPVIVRFPAELVAAQVFEVVPVAVLQDTAAVPLPVAVQVNCSWVRFQPVEWQFVRLGELTLIESTLV
jgi:hypothetical protein